MKLERIIVGVDLREPSLDAARWVARHLAPESEIVLVHALELPELPAFASEVVQLLQQEWVPEEMERARAELADLSAELDGKRIREEVRIGRPARTIAAIAEERKADLVVVGEHGRGGGLGARLGSTAERVIRCAQVPVLLARGMPAGAPRRILAPIDDSEFAPKVLTWAERFRETGVELVVLHALGLELHGRLSLISTESKVREIETRVLAEARAWLEKRLHATGLDGAHARIEVAFGHPGTEIIAAARRFGSDLIVIGGRGAGGVARVLLGSVVNTVLRGAGCPVLVVVDGE